MGAIKPWHLIVLVVVVILPLLVIAAVVALVLMLVRRSRSTASSAPPQPGAPQQGSGPRLSDHAAPEDPRAILDRRLALGEIGPDEHARLRRILDDDRGRNP
jgi:uncharacterized membrane protein